MDMQAAAITARVGAKASRGQYGGRGALLGLQVETPSQTEARLHAAFRAAEIKILERAYTWETIGQDDFPVRLNQEAMALVRDGVGWSQLVPAGGKDGWTLISLGFPAGTNVDGFLDWFATFLRRRATPRAMVVSSLSRGTAGPYFCWGVPVRLREQVVREIEILSTPPRTGVRAVGLI